MQGKYNGWGLYTDARDPRLVVPKRNPAFGWTINVGHKLGRVALMLIIALLAVSIVASVVQG